MHNEQFKTDRKLDKGQLAKIIIGLFILMLGISIIGSCLTKSEFFGLETFYGRFEGLIYFVGIICLAGAQFLFSKTVLGKKQQNKPDSTNIIRMK